jgi:hypothetical protein
MKIGAGMTTFKKTVVYGQTLIIQLPAIASYPKLNNSPDPFRQLPLYIFSYFFV